MELMELEPKVSKDKTKYEVLYVDDEEVNLRGFKANFRKYFKAIDGKHSIYRRRPADE